MDIGDGWVQLNRSAMAIETDTVEDFVRGIKPRIEAGDIEITTTDMGTDPYAIASAKVSALTVNGGRKPNCGKSGLDWLETNYLRYVL